MKKIVMLWALTLGMVFANESAQENILNKVLIKNTQNAIETTQQLQSQLNGASYDEAKIKGLFGELVFNWKKVETLYIAGDLDNNYLDTPRYIDIFHNLKENLNEQMQRVQESNDDVRVALFKNSFKTINALEYVLYSKKSMSKRDIEISKVIANNIQTHLEDILDVYQTQGEKFLSNEVFSNGIVMNTLVQSVYKLKEWRIADVAGLSLKYKNNPNISRSEYFMSKNSTHAIKAILLTHKEVLNSSEFFDFGDMYEKQLNNDDVKKTRELIEIALTKLAQIKNDDLSSKEAQDLYSAVNNIYNHYFFSLIQDLKITSKILDADGD
ncbi:MAG: imelysin family protein [Arcobacteraceae bacterium]